MSNRNQAAALARSGIVAAFATLAFIGTTVIRIPIPATGGYFNLGDTFVFASALLYGPVVGALVGLIGPSASDAIGFPQFVLATAVVKAMEGLVVGAICRKGRSASVAAVGLTAGVAVLVGGYFVFEAYLYPAIGRSVSFFAVTDLNAAIAEVVPNLLQGALSAVMAFAIWRIFTGIGKQ